MNDENERVIGQLRKQLRSLGMAKAETAKLVEEIAIDLRAASGDGTEAQAIVGPDLPAFARDLATARGYPSSPQRMAGLTLVTGLPIAAVAALVYVGLVGGGPTLGLPEFRASVTGSGGGAAFPGVNEGWFVLGAYLVAGVLAFASVLGGAAAYLAWRRDSYIGATLRSFALLLPLGALAGIGLAISFARTRVYATDPVTIGIECALASAGILGGLWLARAWARGLRPRLSLALTPAGRKP